MAFDGNGNWIPEFSAKEDRDAGVKILASRFDDVFQKDLKESFEKCLTIDGQNKFIGNFNFNNHIGVNAADPIDDTDVVNKRTLIKTDNNCVHKTKDETIEGVKTFNSTIKTASPSSATDNSTKVATTAWVRNHRCTTAATTTSTASVDAPAYIIQNYRIGNSWYRVWSDGWIEQGGLTQSANFALTVSFPKAFTTTNYTLLISTHTGCRLISEITRETTGFSGKQYNVSAGSFINENKLYAWHACGY